MQKIIWALLDDRRGSVSQAMGVLGALNKKKFKIEEKKIVYTRLAALPNFLRGRTLLGTNSATKAELSEPYPDYVLSISRRTAPIARYIKKMSPKTKLIQLMHPGNCGLTEFDLIIVPEHDKNKKQTANTHYIVGCPHRITPEFLSEAKQKWQSKFADLPKPLTAVIIGGAIKGRPFTADDVQKFCLNIKQLKQNIGGSLLITTSRRTGAEAEKIIKNELKDFPQYNFYWGDQRENPYAGFLACADNIVITADSVSMCCEATATEKPIYLFIGSSKWMTQKHLRFAKSLLDSHTAISLEDWKAVEFFPKTKLNAATEIAQMIEKL